MQDASIPANIHRFHDHIAVYMGNGETVYLKPSDVRVFAKELLECADDVTGVPCFQYSLYKSKDFKFQGKC